MKDEEISVYLQALGGERFVVESVPCFVHGAGRDEFCFREINCYHIPAICPFRLWLYFGRKSLYPDVYEGEGKRRKNL